MADARVHPKRKAAIASCATGLVDLRPVKRRGRELVGPDHKLNRTLAGLPDTVTVAEAELLRPVLLALAASG
jgi:hypothetical protein